MEQRVLWIVLFAFTVSATTEKGNVEDLKDETPCIDGEPHCGIGAVGIGNVEEKKEKNPCKEGDYYCGKDTERNRCIPKSFVCDGTYDCGDGNDEDKENCPAKPETEAASFLRSSAFIGNDVPLAAAPPHHAPAASPPAADIPFIEEHDAPTFPLEFGR